MAWELEPLCKEPEPSFDRVSQVSDLVDILINVEEFSIYHLNTELRLEKDTNQLINSPKEAFVRRSSYAKEFQLGLCSEAILWKKQTPSKCCD